MADKGAQRAGAVAGAGTGSTAAQRVAITKARDRLPPRLDMIKRTDIE